jgi:hypothetical protein
MTMLAKAKLVRFSALVLTISTVALLAGFEAPPAFDGRERAEAGLGSVPDTTLPAKVIDAAGVYTAYVERAAAISPAFTSGKSVAASLQTGETYESEQIQRGLTAYAAIVALQEPTFVATVRSFAADPQRAQIVAWIMDNPTYAVGFRGSDRAAGLIVAALNDQGRRVLDTGRRVKQAAYDVQHQTWSKADVPARPARLALAKTLSAAPLSAGVDDRARLRLASTGDTPLNVAGSPVPPPYTPTVVRALAIAALAALGDGGEAYSEQLTALLAEPDEGECLHMAKLNLYQCLAVSKPHYEDVFCLGQHILMDTGQCIIKGATARGADISLIPTVSAQR